LLRSCSKRKRSVVLTYLGFPRGNLLKKKVFSSQRNLLLTALKDSRKLFARSKLKSQALLKIEDLPMENLRRNA
jgi:hypothetical protein